MRPSPAPARSNGADGFPVRRSPVGFVPRVMRPIALGALSGPDLISHLVVIEDPERGTDPRRTPPLPAKAPTAPRPHHMAPHLLLDPDLHESKAPCRVPHPEVVHPAPQDRVDHLDDLPYRLGAPAPEHLPELTQQRRPLLHGRRLLHPPPAPQRAKSAKGKAQETERLSLGQVYDSALRLVQTQIEFRELLPQSPLQHRIHLGEVDVTEYGGDHPALRNPALTGCLQHQLEQVQDLSILNAARYLREKLIMPHAVKVGGHIQIDRLRLALEDRLRHPRHRVMRFPLRTIAVRAVVKARFEDRLHDEFKRPLDHAIPYGRYP